ncbi:MAG: FTR1 family iron permease [Bifidobacteriaceae bacterium]|nr:FTR1 family iron permease [Bifidobacteriaceae bacterium]
MTAKRHRATTREANSIRKTLLALLLGAAALLGIAAPACALAGAPGAAPAASAGAETWGAVVEEMDGILEDAWEQYQAGDTAGAKAQVDVAYYSYYEKLGFEKVVMAHISGKTASEAEYEFGLIKKAMSNGQSEQARAHIDTLEAILADQAEQLDGTEESAWRTLSESLIVILREGFEAIIVLGAIIAYLIKSGNRQGLRTVYLGAILALVASAALAVAINAITALSGANQEITEGVTVLIAAVMLVWVSNWILGKSDASAWTRYIEAKAAASISRGSVFSLALVAFLAVFREGAETILLYQALRARVEATQNMLWLGLGIGAVLLVGVYLAIRYLSIRIPLRPFFLGTSTILAVLAFSFAGSGIKELQEGGVVSITPVAQVPTVDLLGIYPSAETLAAQALTLAAIAALSVFALRRVRRRRDGAVAPAAKPASPAPSDAAAVAAAPPDAAAGPAASSNAAAGPAAPPDAVGVAAASSNAAAGPAAQNPGRLDALSVAVTIPDNPKKQEETP